MATSSTESNPMTELKASAHLMSFEAGVFCVFTAPGAAPADAATGLPGVRITKAPAQSGFAGQVSISGFNSDGWLGGSEDATLVRVTGGPAQVLMTVYQAKDSAQPAPELKVMRLTEPPAPAPAPEQARKAAPQQPAARQAAPIEVAAHVYGVGDVGGPLGEWMGERGSKRWIEGFGLAPAAGIAAGDIEYQAVLGRGWLSPWAEGGQFCGSRGMSLPILGLRVRLRGAAAEAFTATVEATFVDGSTAGPVTDGAACEAPSLAALEAFRIVLKPRAAAAQPSRGRAAPAPAPKQAAPVKAKVAPAKTKAAPVKAPPQAVPPKAAAKPKRTPATTRRR